jgi:hypothetical protein
MDQTQLLVVNLLVNDFEALDKVVSTIGGLIYMALHQYNLFVQKILNQSGRNFGHMTLCFSRAYFSN